MSLKEFLKEQKEERKRKKLEKKQAKKSPLTKEQKYYKIAGLIVGILVTFGAIFYSCGSLAGGNPDLMDILGITDEMVEAIKEPVDENLIFVDGRLSFEDLTACKIILNDANANALESEEELFASKNFSLNSRETGALAREMLASLNSDFNLDVLSYKIYKTNNAYYEKSVVKINLDEIISGKDLPEVYLISMSKIDILGDSICILDTSLQINMIDKEINDQIIELLETYDKFNFKSTVNNMINTVLNMFAANINTKIKLIDDGIQFRI